MKIWTQSKILAAMGIFIGLSSPNLASASIIGTSVDTGMEIRYGSEVDASATSSGSISAGVDLIGAVTGATAYSNLWFSELNDESAVFNFDLGYDGNDYDGIEGGYLGESDSSSYANTMAISYFAESDLDVNVSWDFDYAGADPFGLQIVRLIGLSSELALGDVGNVGNHNGSTSYSLTGGNSYLFEVSFIPNVSGGISFIEGSLSGSFEFAFDTVAVPEPSSIALLTLGLLGVGAARRRRQL